MSGLDGDRPIPAPLWKRILRWIFWTLAILLGAVAYFAFEEVRTPVHIGVAVMIGSLMLKDIVQGWVREVIRQETKNERERIYSISQRINDVDSRIRDLARWLGR